VQLMMVGLGRMGGNMAERLLQKGHQVVVFDPSAEARDRLAAMGGRAVASLKEGVAALSPPRVVWVMVPSGEVTEVTLTELAALLDKGDTVVDGGNSFYRESMRHGAMLAEKGIDFLDAGTSGGIWGLREGYCLMVGGTDAAYARVEPALRSLAPEGGLLHTGPVGSGHFVKMVHNGIEYGMLQAYGEGFEILEKGPFPLDLAAVAGMWNHSSVIRSWLLELAEDAFRKDPKLAALRGYVEDTGEGRWTVAQALEENVPAPVITLSLLMRLRSRQDESFSAKVIAALRNEFGGHAVKAE
jgi:6-phosphogluconate dehydrogenase